MIDIVNLYNELSPLSHAQQQARLAQLKEVDVEKTLELARMLTIDDITLSSTDFLAQQISPLKMKSWQSFIGQQVMGFTIKGLLSNEGGMGLVFHAEQTLPNPSKGYCKNHKAAIKVLRADKLNSEQQKLMFFSEASSLMDLDHPNICSLYGVAEIQGEACIVMDYIDGQSLAQWLKEGKKNKQQKIEVFLQLLDAVCYLHARQVYHGDLKPQNIIVNDQGHLIVIDLGLSRKFKQIDIHEPIKKNEEAEYEAIKAFSKNWSAPELVAGEACSTMSDVYSLGAILSYLLIEEIERQALPKKNDDKELNSVVLKALSTQPLRRYHSADQLRTALEKYQQGYPLDEHSTGAIYQTQKLIIRNPMGALACALGVYSFVISSLLWVK